MEFICCCCQILEAHWGTQGSWKHIRRKTWSVKYKINKSIYQLHYSIWNFCNLLLKFVRGHCRRKHQRKYLNIPSDMFCKSSVLVCVLECFVICHLTCLLIIKKKKNIIFVSSSESRAFSFALFLFSGLASLKSSALLDLHQTESEQTIPQINK